MQKTFRFFFPLKLFLLLKVIYSFSLVVCPKSINAIYTSLYSPHPQCPRLTPFPKDKVSITHHIHKRNDLLSKKLRHWKCVLGLWEQESGEQTDPWLSPVQKGKGNSCERSVWPEVSLGGAGDQLTVSCSAPLHLCTANCCCCSNSLEQRVETLIKEFERSLQKESDCGWRFEIDRIQTWILVLCCSGTPDAF